MREAKDAEGVAAVRLRAVLSGRRSAGQAPPDAPVGELAAGGGPLRWSDIVPGWSEEVEREAGGVPGAGYPARAAWAAPPNHPIEEGAGLPGAGAFGRHDAAGLTGGGAFGRQDAGLSGAGASGRQDAAGPTGGGAFGLLEAAGLSGVGAFGSEGGARRRWLHAFDPGRGGVRALAAVAVVVVLIAAVLAWRARPRVDPVAPGAVEATGAATGGPSGPAAGAGGPAAELVVAVGGKVRRPGLVRLAPGSRVADALSAAGGAEPGVDVALLNPARKVTDGELILVGVSAPPGGVGAAPGAAGPAVGGPLNLNTATLAQLDALPGVGPVLAQRILDARQAQGGFRSVGDLRKVDGIGESRYEQLKDLVTV